MNHLATIEVRPACSKAFLVFCLFASATDPRTSTFLFRSSIGLACLGAGLALDVVGAFWMRRLCRVVA